MNFTNPTSEDIRQWAYSCHEWPHDEWDMFLSWTGEIDFFIELATDYHCINRLFFLHVLYNIIAITYNELNKSDKLQKIRFYQRKGLNINHGDIRQWVHHIDLLLAGKESYKYENWRGGLYANYHFI